MSKTPHKFAPEVCERTVRMALDHERDHPSRWAAVVSIAEKLKALERENRELDVLRKSGEVLAQRNTVRSSCTGLMSSSAEWRLTGLQDPPI